MTGAGAISHNGEAGGEGEHDGLAPTWRHLSFYEATRVRDVADFASSPSSLRSPNEIASIANCAIRPAFVKLQHTNGHANASTSSKASPSYRQQSVLVGDMLGNVRVLDAEDYSPLGSWQAFHGSAGGGMGTGRVTHLSCDSKGRVVTLGEDDDARFPIIRVWDLTTASKSQDGPRLLTEGKVQHGSRPYPIAALAHTPTLSFLSIGLADGSVLLLRGLDDVLLQSTSMSADGANAAGPVAPLPKFKVAFQPSASKAEEVTSAHEAVTGLGFAEHLARPTTADQGRATSKRGAGTGAKASNGARAGRKSLAAAGLMDRQSEGHGAPETVNLFIVTLSRILRYTVLGKGAGLPASVVDDVGCALGCARLVPLGGDPLNSLQGKMIVARDEAIYVVGPEGREMSLAYEGPKSSIQLAATQLVIVSPPMTASAVSNSATVRHYVAGRDRMAKAAGRSGSPRAGLAANEVAKVTVFDLDNKLVAYSGTFEGGVREAWVGSKGDICVLGDDGAMTRLEEKTLRQKLDLLFRKSLFLLAVNVAKSHASRSIASAHEVDHINPLLADIHRKYGDSLYEKGDFEGAMSQFVKTIGFAQPSYVIRKFLDAQRITNLTTYLQELHTRGLANSDHTTLLLNCYTKLKDVASLDRFIKRPIVASPARVDREDTFGAEDEDLDGEKEELPFDLETAIRVCRQAGYFEHAAYLARRYQEHDEYIRIQIEDIHDFENAMQHIRGLSADEAERNLLRYGKAMLDEIPQKTTDLLIELCSGAFQPTPMAVGAGVDASKSGQNGKSAAAAYLTYLQVGGFGKSTQTGAEHQEGAATPATVPTEGEEYESKEAAVQSAGPSVSYSVPLPRLFFAHFISHPLEFRRFLETVALARWGQSIDMDIDEERAQLVTAIGYVGDGGDNSDDVDPDVREQRSIWNTLLELYLTLARPSSHALGGAVVLDGAQQLQQKEKALRLLHQYEHLPYDISQALMVCSQEEFSKGVVFLYERMAMYEDILHLHMDKGKEEGALMECLARYGSVEPQLYPMLLRYLASSEQLLSRHQNNLERILAHIEEERLMSPLEVVQTLSKKSVASVGLIRSHLIRSIKSQQSDIETNAKLTMTYRTETEEKSREIDSLRDISQPKIFQQTKCNACGGSLDLPIIHFMCKHSFHSRCLGEEEKECPLCAKSHGVILEIRKNNLAFGERQDLFLNEVEEAEDGFDVVASMFSKGLFGPQQLGERA